MAWFDEKLILQGQVRLDNSMHIVLRPNSKCWFYCCQSKVYFNFLEVLPLFVSAPQLICTSETSHLTVCCSRQCCLVHWTSISLAVDATFEFILAEYNKVSLLSTKLSTVWQYMHFIQLPSPSCVSFLTCL